MCNNFITRHRSNFHAMWQYTMSHPKNKSWWDSPISYNLINQQLSQLSMETDSITLSLKPDVLQITLTSLQNSVLVIKEMSITAAISPIWIVIPGLTETLIYLKVLMALKQSQKPSFIMNRLKLILKKWFTWPKIIPKDLQNMQYQTLLPLITFIENIFTALFTPFLPSFQCSQIKSFVKVQVLFVKACSWLKPLIVK